jgi:hypothetical protein
MGTLEGTLPQALPLNLLISVLQVVFRGFEEYGDQIHQGVEHMALGSFARLYAQCVASEGIHNGYPRRDHSQGTTHQPLCLLFTSNPPWIFEWFGNQKHHGVEHMALGSSASRYA